MSGSGISIRVQAQNTCLATLARQVGMGDHEATVYGPEPDDASITKWQYTIAYQAPGDRGAWPVA